ncbi:MAG: gliding motility-associated C-terminal domain-containing protein [Bacteroidia bacterium]
MLFILLSLIPFIGSSTHLVGGSFRLEWLSGSTYRLTIKVIRDCENGNPNAYFDIPTWVGLFEKGSHTKKQSIRLNWVEDDTLVFTGFNCPSITTGCTHIGTLSATVELPDAQYGSTGGYYLAWERCCRNGIISNLQRPGDAAMVIYAEIPPPRFVKNNTPYYTSNPRTLMCVNNLFKYNMKFIDPDGDKLKYKLIDPLNGNLDRNNPSTTNPQSGPYSNTIWANGYGNQNAINGTLPLTIDSVTGEISCIPSAAGIYVASILVEEFRFGIKIGEVRLELQFTVTTCPNNPPLSSVVSLDNTIIVNDTIDIEVPDRVCFKIRGMDMENDSVYLRVRSPIADSLFNNLPIYDTLVGGLRIAEGSFCMEAACEHLRMKSPFPVYIDVKDNACPINKESESKFWVRIKESVAPSISITNLDGTSLKSDTLEVQVPNQFCLKIKATDPRDQVYLKVHSPILAQPYQIKPVFDTLSVGLKEASTNFCFQSACEHESIVSPFPVYVEASDRLCPDSKISYDTFWVSIQPMPLQPSTDMLCMTLFKNAETAVYWGDSSSRNDPNFLQYYLYRFSGAGNLQIVDSISDKNRRFFLDKNTPEYANINYRYFMVPMNQCRRMGASSDTLGTFEQLKFMPDRQFINYASVEANKAIHLSWDASKELDFAKYHLYKTIKGGSFTLLKTFEQVTDTFYFDEDVEVGNYSYCYYLVMQDTCDNIGEMGRVACTILLKGESESFQSKLNWTNYQGWLTAPLTYEVLRADPSMSETSIFSLDSLKLNHVDDKLNLNEGLFFYTIQATENLIEGSFPYTSRSNTIELIQSPNVYVPNAFTANGDGLNDVFKWVPVFVKDFHIEIYNRWGGKVFESDNKLDEWDAKIGGSPVASDVFFYILNYTGYNGVSDSRKGNFTILR